MMNSGPPKHLWSLLNIYIEIYGVNLTCIDDPDKHLRWSRLKGFH